MAAAGRWIENATNGRPVEPEERDSIIGALGILMDSLADPSRVLQRGGTTLLPSVNSIPVVGAVPPPGHWFSGTYRPAGASPLEVNTDAIRRTGWGLAMGVVRDITSTGRVIRDPAPRPTTGFLPALILLAPALAPAVAIGGGIYAWQHEETAREVERQRQETERTRIQEQQATARFTAQCQQVIQLYTQRLAAWRETGRDPPTSAAERAPETVYSPAQRARADQELSSQSRLRTVLYVAGGIAAGAAVLGGVLMLNPRIRAATGSEIERVKQARMRDAKLLASIAAPEVGAALAVADRLGTAQDGRQQGQGQARQGQSSDLAQAATVLMPLVRG